MTYRAKRVDENQPEIVQALKEAGASVQHLHEVGQGCPDLLVGYGKVNFLLEVKDPLKKPSEQRLNPRQSQWWETWGGTAHVVKTPSEALRAIGAL